MSSSDVMLDRLKKEFEESDKRWNDKMEELRKQENHIQTLLSEIAIFNDEFRQYIKIKRTKW